MKKKYFFKDWLHVTHLTKDEAALDSCELFLISQGKQKILFQLVCITRKHGRLFCVTAPQSVSGMGKVPRLYRHVVRNVKADPVY